MNRIILVGNGFDLAHGLKTRYEDFINWYFEQLKKSLANCNYSIYEDGFCKLQVNFEMCGVSHLGKNLYILINIIYQE